jgi:hypothetical protein
MKITFGSSTSSGFFFYCGGRSVLLRVWSSQRLISSSSPIYFSPSTQHAECKTDYIYTHTHTHTLDSSYYRKWVCDPCVSLTPVRRPTLSLTHSTSLHVFHLPQSKILLRKESVLECRGKRKRNVYSMYVLLFWFFEVGPEMEHWERDKVHRFWLRWKLLLLFRDWIRPTLQEREV